MIRHILIYIHIFICICLLYGTILDQSNEAYRYYINNFLFIKPTQKISLFTCIFIIVFMVYNYLLNNDDLLGRFMNEYDKETNIITLFYIPYNAKRLDHIIRKIINLI